jgi:hypothetical protein
MLDIPDTGIAKYIDCAMVEGVQSITTPQLIKEIIMAETKYSKYFTTECLKPSPMRDGVFLTTTRNLEWAGGGNCSIDCFFITQPLLMLTQPHQHEFAQYLHFFSANPQDATEFDAEVEISLGEEGEKHIIRVPTALYIPAGLYHGPLNFAKVDKPILFIDLALTGKYARVGDTPD